MKKKYFPSEIEPKWQEVWEKEGLYKFDFVSAKWSPDLAGWSLVVAVASLVGFIISLLYRWFIKMYL